MKSGLAPTELSDIEAHPSKVPKSIGSRRCCQEVRFFHHSLNFSTGNAAFGSHRTSSVQAAGTTEVVFFGRFLLPGGRPRRLICFIHAGGRPRLRPRPWASRSNAMF